MNGWTNNLPFKDIAFKAIHITLSLLLQKKPSKTSKVKDHLKALKRRIGYGTKERLASFYFRARQFNHVHITSTHQKALVNYLRSLLY